MSKKIFLVIVAFLGTIIGLWVWTFVAPSNSISIGGSASVDPLMQRLTNQYKKNNKTKFSYSSTGSGSGITNVKNGVYKAGFISKAVPSSDKTFEDYNLINDNSSFFLNNEEKDKSQEGYYNYLVNKREKIENDKENMHYVTFAHDSIVFIYNIKDLNFEPFVGHLKFVIDSVQTFEDKQSEVLPKLDSQAIEILKRIYENDSPNTLWTWQDLAYWLAENEKESETKEDLMAKAKKVSSKKIIPYTTTPGSGTRSSFQTITNNQVTPGAASHAYNSNGAIFSQINYSAGSFGYLSMNYAINTRDHQKFSNLKTAIIAKDGEEYNIADTNQNNWERYPLYRPFIGLFKSSYTEAELKIIANFMYWMSNSKDVEDIYEHEYLIKVLKSQPIEQNENVLLNEKK
ncbi:phosphate ABC transporter substrate-binding protein [Mesoplasma syrphidae]|uniref:Phosphate ABC transporter substrate-binding protein n=1 Tax=Mesoplasma syrphidae TaxID=225999 RepID=A0A2K9BUM1_9MOLU|nr:phosphate ABC transporter substrate-binding protein [Mesoplasma syrphidae]AUF83410.1 phosphate ABC transporter substrate-binding protein [Mesoplasma syrphidae]